MQCRTSFIVLDYFCANDYTVIYLQISLELDLFAEEDNYKMQANAKSVTVEEKNSTS